MLPEIEPRTFSFNTPHGACPDCQGLGGKLEIDPDLLIPDRDLSLNEGAIVVSEWSGPREEGGYYWQTLEAVAQHYHIDLDAPVNRIPPEKTRSGPVRHAAARRSPSITTTRMVARLPSALLSKA